VSVIGVIIVNFYDFMCFSGMADHGVVVRILRVFAYKF